MRGPREWTSDRREGNAGGRKQDKVERPGGIRFRHLGKLGKHGIGGFLVLAEKLNGPGTDVLFGVIEQSHELGILALESARNLKGPQGPQTLAHGLGILQHRFEFPVYLG